MDLPYVSVIILNYNGAHFLPACLDALDSQTYPNGRFEVIVSDNGSSDNSLHLLKESYPWVRVLENGKNLGFASGNNVAIKRAKGEYKILLTNDTAPLDEWLEALVKTARSHPGAGMVTGHLQMFYDQVELRLETNTFVPPGDERSLGVQVFNVDSGTPRGVVQYLDGFYGREPGLCGERFRWTKAASLLGVPVPPGSGSWSLELQMAAPRPQSQDVQLKIYTGDTLLDAWTVSASRQSYRLTLPASSRDLARPLEQNTGSIIFWNGSGRDRGTYVRNFELFHETATQQYGQEEEVFAGCGASLLLKQDMLDEVGLLDDDFFMYYEDTDLSWRARLRDWNVYYAPNAVVRHIHCGTSEEWSPFFLYLTERNRLAMVFKNGAVKQVARVWGGYTLKDARLAWNTLLSLLTFNPDWRTKGGRLRVHLHVMVTLLLWQPGLWSKRYRIQKGKKISHRQLEGWFKE